MESPIDLRTNGSRPALPLRTVLLLNGLAAFFVLGGAMVSSGLASSRRARHDQLQTGHHSGYEGEPEVCGTPTLSDARDVADLIEDALSHGDGPAEERSISRVRDWRPRPIHDARLGAYRPAVPPACASDAARFGLSEAVGGAGLSGLGRRFLACLAILGAAAGGRRRP